jgi:hypothetical protein
VLALPFATSFLSPRRSRRAAGFFPRAAAFLY